MINSPILKNTVNNTMNNTVNNTTEFNSNNIKDNVYPVVKSTQSTQS